MNLYKQPSTAAPLNLRHIAAGFRALGDSGAIRAFERAFAAHCGTRSAIATGNGTTALYAVLLAMRAMMPDRDEVILPAYTVPTLTLAIRAAGLKTVLCDISRDTFNMDAESLASAISDRTLAAVPVHMFGFPCDLNEILAVGREHWVFILEDACQAPGALLGGKRVGSIGDAGIFSFCKGKNLTSFHGGMITTESDVLADKMCHTIAGLANRGLLYRAGVPALVTALAFAMHPAVYGPLYPAIAHFKSTEVHENFHPTKYNRFMAGVAHAQLSGLDAWNAVRIHHGHMMRDALSSDRSIAIPVEVPDSEPVYNHLPVVFHDPGRVERVQRSLWARGIDSGRMYERPIHHIYDDIECPATEEPYPNASYLAPRLLTLPTHPYLNDSHINIIIDTVLKTA